MTTPTVRRPLRVCFLIDRLDTAGTETQLLALIRELDRSRVEPSLCLLDGTDARSISLEPTDCPVFRAGIRSLRQPDIFRRLWKIAGFWREQRPDVVQVYFLDSAYVGVPLARLCGVPHVVRVRNNLGYWLTGPHRGLGRLLKYGLDATLTNSEPGRKSVLRAEGGKPSSVVVLENGVDLDRFRTRRPPDTARRTVVRIGAVANLRPVKQLDHLVQAAALIAPHYPRCVFEIAGEGPERGRLESLAAAHGLGDRFRLHGAVGDVPAFLERLDVAVLCSKSEGMSNALMEYMAAGRAIVATKVGANATLLQNGACGMLVEPGDVAGLADALRSVMDDAPLAARLGEAARRSVRERYGRDAMRRRFEDFYERLCRPGRAAKAGTVAPRSDAGRKSHLSDGRRLQAAS